MATTYTNETYNYHRAKNLKLYIITKQNIIHSQNAQRSQNFIQYQEFNIIRTDY